MAALTPDQLSFLRSQKIAPNQLFDASGIRKRDYTELMRIDGLHFAFGASPCAKGGHTLRSSAGHCIQCDTRKIAYTLRHYETASVYLAGSYSMRLMKVGLAKDVDDRATNINAYKYGGAEDWEILLDVYTDHAGTVEFDVHEKLERYAQRASYIRAGRSQECREVFRCGYAVAKKAILSSLPANANVRCKDDKRALVVFDF